MWGHPPRNPRRAGAAVPGAITHCDRAKPPNLPVGEGARSPPPLERRPPSVGAGDTSSFAALASLQTSRSGCSGCSGPRRPGLAAPVAAHKRMEREGLAPGFRRSDDPYARAHGAARSRLPPVPQGRAAHDAGGFTRRVFAAVASSCDFIEHARRGVSPVATSPTLRTTPASDSHCSILHCETMNICSTEHDLDIAFMLTLL